MICGLCVTGVISHVQTQLMNTVVHRIKRQLDYARNFHKNVEKLKEEKEELEMARARLRHEIEEAERKLQRIEGDVRDSLSKADKILRHVESMEEEIANNERCFCGCPNWWWQYQLSKKLEKTLRDIFKILEKIAKFGQPGRVSYRDASTMPTIEFLSSKDFMFSKSSRAAFDQIMEAIAGSNVSMIALWGMGGVGKTTLVHEVGNEAKKLNLFDKVVVATVSKKPHFETIQDEIAKFLDFDMKNERGRRSKQELWSRLQKEKRILIILDDVWTKINLKEDIGIPLGQDHTGCKILLTTRRLQVCQSMDCQMAIPLGCLDDDEAWALFERKAGLKNSHDAIKMVAAEVVKKCQGLPISVVTLGAALKGKTLARWKAVCRRLKTRRLMDIEDINQENAYLCLEVSFDYLKDMETKICFLLCSLFPEDYEIYVEDLVRYAWGLDLYKDTDSTEEVRTEVHGAIDILKDSSLLLDCGERHVKMHDTVRDVALWIASNRKEIAFVIKSEVVETWPRNGSFEPCTAISLKTIRIAELPDGLVCPNLKILLLGGDGSNYMRTASRFFEGMKTLQVCSLHDRWISPDAFQFQTNLRTLHLKSCNLSSISVLGKLKKLQVLTINWSDINHLPDKIGDLNNLRVLDLSNCEALRRIPRHLIQRLFQLEELYLDGCRLLNWATENTTQEGSCASLFELNSLSKLIILSLEVASEHLPKNFVFQKLLRFNICIDKDVVRKRRYKFDKRSYENCPISRSLKIEASALNACKNLFGDMESFNLKNLVGCQNLVQSLQLNQEVFNKLTSLGLESCEGMKCLVDTTKQPEALTIAFPNLVELSLSSMSGLEEFCHGPQPQGFLQKLKTLSIRNCKDIISAVPVLQDLEVVEVCTCDKLQVLFRTDELNNIDEEPNFSSLLPWVSPELRTIQHWPSHNINLHSLKVVRIDSCNELVYLFPISVAKSLGQLEKLEIDDCCELEEIIQNTEMSNISLQSLRNVFIGGCNHLKSLSSLSHGQVLQNLTKLTIFNCSRLEYTFPFSMVEGLPQLKVVELLNLPLLNGRNGNDIVLTLPSLHDLNVTYCPELAPFIISSKIQELQIANMTKRKQLCDIVKNPELRRGSTNVECLEIAHFEELFNGGYNLSSLRRLLLHELPELWVIWKGPIQVVNFQNLTELSMVECKRLRYVFPLIVAENLPQLSSLEILDCEKLEQIIGKDKSSSQDHHLQSICFPNLTDIYIEGCKNLKSLFSVSTVAHGLPKLKHLSVLDISKLEQVFEGGDAANVSMTDEDKVIKLPQLEKLYLKKLPSVVSFSPVGYHFIFPSLQDLHVMDCPNRTTSFSVDSKQCGHVEREELQISKMTHSEELFDGGFNLSSLKQLWLGALPELRVIWKAPIQVVNFQNLTELTVVKCKSLRCVFPPSVAGNLPQFTCLQIQDCKELEQIIGGDGTASQDHPLQPIFFPNLTKICIRRCGNLKSLFSVSTIAQGLPKLKILFVGDVPKLEQVFEQGDVINFSMATEDKEIKLPRLEQLSLRNLPNIVSFGPVGYHFIFPSLQDLRVIDCPNMTTRFSVDSNQNGHAKAEVSQSIDENIMVESAVAQETTLPIGSNFEWSYHHEVCHYEEYSSELSEETDEVNISEDANG